MVSINSSQPPLFEHAFCYAWEPNWWPRKVFLSRWHDEVTWMRKMIAMQKTGETFPDRCKGLQIDISLVEVIGLQKTSVTGVCWGKNQVEKTAWERRVRSRVSDHSGQSKKSLGVSAAKCLSCSESQVSSLSNSAVVIGGWNKRAGLKFHCYWLWSQTGFSLFTFRTLIWCLNCARHCFKCITNNWLIHSLFQPCEIDYYHS